MKRSEERGDASRERVEITCLVRFRFVPEARMKKIVGKDFFYRLTAFRKVAAGRGACHMHGANILTGRT